jgi:hypothetical protein
MRAARSEPDHSVSPSRQFVIYGGDVRLRGAVSNIAEEMKGHLVSLLHAGDDWKIPIVINLQAPQANVPEMPASFLNFSQTGAGLKLQLDFVITSDVRATPFEREIVRALLLERMYRRHGDLAVGTAYVEPPAWLLDAISAKPAAAREARVPIPSTLPALEEFLQILPQPIDSEARQLYRLYSIALLDLLGDGREGAARISHYLDNLSIPSRDSLAEVKALFPALSASDVDTRWKTKVRALARGHDFALLSFDNTRHALDQFLLIKTPAATVPLTELAKRNLTRDEKAALKITAQNLMVLGGTAHPLLRPVVSEYQHLAELMERGRIRGEREHLAKLQEVETRLSARMNDVQDYMNWFEATQVDAPSGAFDNYLRTAGQTDGPGRRRDGLSVYLDAIAVQLQN